ncbi:MAG: hypothetical protein FWD44_03470 [Oscillospiraceae bacterium]|nr:hypothetical protein [Oscillospiraceae bacterium]
MKLFDKSKKDSRIETIYGIERLYLKNYSDVLYVIAKKGPNIRQICTLDEYEKGIVRVHDESGKRVMITLQSVSR